MRLLFRLRRVWLLVAALVAMIVAGGASLPQPVDAETLLERAYQSGPVALSADQVSHSRSTVYERINPDATEPPDPYHRPYLPLLTDTTVAEQWTRGGPTPQSRFTLRDARTGRVLQEMINDGTRLITYIADDGYANVMTVPSQSASPSTPPLPFPEFARQKGLKIIGAAPSAWGKPAWIVQSLHVPAPPEVLSSRLDYGHNQPPLRQKQYLKDLTVTGFEYLWIVDQESEQMVQIEWRALTPAGPVVLLRTENTAPEILPATSLPPNWLAFPLDSVPVFEAHAPTPGTPPDALSLPEAIAAADFAVFLPEPSPAGLEARHVSFNPQPEPPEVWQKHWVFDIQDASARGLTLQVVYVPPTSDGRALVVVQGPSARLVPLMRETLPIWSQSHKVRLVLADEPVTAWMATGGLMDHSPKVIAMMFELQQTFVFVVGQSFAEDQVLAIVRSLRRQR